MLTFSRRQVLGGAVAALTAGLSAGVTGCEQGAAPSTPRPTPTEPDPLLAQLADERGLLAAYDAVLQRHPSLSRRLRPLRADHADHVAALSSLLDPASDAPTSAASTSQAPAAASSPAGSGAVSPPSAPVPGSPKAVLSMLRAAERAAAATRSAACLAASPAGRAALLGTVAACEASHEVLLQ